MLMLTTFDLDDYVYEALRAGASGFLLKDATAAELVHAVRVVAAGDALLAPAVTRRLIADFARQPRPDPPFPAALAVLTHRESEVLRLIARGLSNTEISDTLVIAQQTTKTYVGRILAKLDLRDRAQAVVFAYETGLVTPGGSGPQRPARIDRGPWPGQMAFGVDTLIQAMPASPRWRRGSSSPRTARSSSGRSSAGWKPRGSRGSPRWPGRPGHRGRGLPRGAVSQQRWKQALGPLPVLWVGVRCAGAVAAGRRSPGDRVTGMAASQADVVHQGVVYDLQVDTTHSEALECARGSPPACGERRRGAA